jgi:hypothetical protein
LNRQGAADAKRKKIIPTGSLGEFDRLELHDELIFDEKVELSTWK